MPWRQLDPLADLVDAATDRRRQHAREAVVVDKEPELVGVGRPLPVRLLAVEDAPLAGLPCRLLTPEFFKPFTKEFAREVERLTRTRTDVDADARARLAVLDTETVDLGQHFIGGTVTATLATILAMREAERNATRNKPSSRSIMAIPVVVPTRCS